MRKLLPTIALNVLLIGVYFITAKIGLFFAFEQANTTPIWPPTGVSIAALLYLGYRIVPAIFLGSVLLNLTIAKTPVWVAFTIAGGNLAEALVAAMLITHYIGRYPFNSIKNTLSFIPLALLCPLISAFVGVGSLFLSDQVESTQLSVIFTTWWLGNVTGALVFTPLCLTFALKPRLEFTLPRLLETTAILICAIFSAYMVFSPNNQGFALSFILIPTTVWAAIRFYQHGATGIILLYTAVAAWATVQGFGPFVADSVNLSLITLQGFMAVIVATALTLAAGVDEIANVQKQLMHLHNNLELQVKMSTGQLEKVSRNDNRARSGDDCAPLNNIESSLLDAITLELSNIYHCRFAFIGVFENEQKDSIRTISLRKDKQLQENFSYHLTSTPCADVLNQKAELISKDADKAYPNDALLVKMGIKSYFGAPIMTTQGKTKGIIVVMDSKPINVSVWTKPILGLMARRVAYELQHEKSMQELELSAEVFKKTIESIVILDKNRRVIKVNDAFCRMTGYTREEVLGRSAKGFRNHKHEDSFYEKAWSDANNNGHWQGEMWLRRKHSDPFPSWMTITAVSNYKGQLERFIIGITDLSSKIEAQKAIYKLAHYDVLTELPNRTMFLEQLDNTIEKAKNKAQYLGVVFMDLDKFKLINDASGHYTGDVLLVQVAKRLKQMLPQNVLLSRFGGDEFTLLVNDVECEEQVQKIAKLLLSALITPFYIESKEVIVTTSIGYSVYPRDGRSGQELLKNADIAMHQAKQSGLERVKQFTEPMNLMAKQRVEIERALRDGLKLQQFLLHYQVQIDAKRNVVTGCEALVRWQHPDFGLVPPDNFIPIAEESGLIVPLGEWIVEQACRQYMQWLEDGLNIDCIAVNLSARQFVEPNLCNKLEQIVKAVGIQPQALELELTESMLMEDIDSAVKTMQRLKQMGFKLSIDDFGTGYSSMAYLKHFPIDKLKIDRSFVDGLPENDKDVAIISTIISLAQGLSLEVIAEGVETEAQKQLLNTLSCAHMQGYHFAKPLPGDDDILKQLLANKAIAAKVFVK